MRDRRVHLRVSLLLAIASGAFGQSAALPRFEVVSIKPNAQGGSDIQGLGIVRVLPGGRLSAEKAQLRYLIQNAYGLRAFQLTGGPGWIDSAHFDIEAKADGDPSPAQMRLMMQALLADRFKLTAHRETKELPVYELTAAKGGLKLEQPKPGSCVAPDPNAPPMPPAPGQPAPCGRILMTMSPTGARMRGANVTMAELVRILSNVLARTVVDKTGFTGSFDIQLEFAPDMVLAGLPRPPTADPSSVAPSADTAGPSLFSAVQEQLGLKLESAKGPVEVLIIDHVERPSGN